MEKLIILSALFLFSSFTVNQNDVEPRQVNPAFNTNESLTYLLYYGFIHGGKATISLEKKDNRTLYAIAKAKTIGITSAIVDIDDKYSSYFDEYTGKPYKAIRDIKEGNYTYYNEVTFDHKNNTVNSKKSGEIAVPENIYDIVSAFYFARNKAFKNMQPNDTIRIQTFFANEIFPLVMIYNGKEIIKTKAGKFSAHKLTPIVETGRIFKESDDMRMWVSADDNYLPLRFEFDLILGSIKCDLVEYNNVKNKLAKLR